MTKPKPWRPLDDVLGTDASPLDRPLHYTVFPNVGARTKQDCQGTLREIAKTLQAEQDATEKMKLPLLKLGRFGAAKSAGGSLRHDANFMSFDGIEGDYDGGEIGITEAADKLRCAGCAGVLYPTASHTPEKPRWRVLCPLSATTLPGARQGLVQRLDDVFGGKLATESKTASQTYFFGRLRGAPAGEVIIVEGRALNELAPSACATVPDDDDDDDDDDFQRPVDLGRVKSALASIPVTVFDADGGRDDWLRIGMAVHHASRGSDEGLKIWDDWSKGGAKYNERQIRKDWRSFDAPKPIEVGNGKAQRALVTVATIYDMAKKYGWPDTDPIDNIGISEPAPRKLSNLRILTPDECERQPARGYVVKGLIAPKDLVCIFGPPGAGKSLIGPHIGYQTAHGRDAFGLRTKQGTVLYVAAEDSHGMSGRVAALKRRSGSTSHFRLVEGVSDLLDSQSADLAELRQWIEKLNPMLIIIDTLAMAFPRLEENSAEAMGRVVDISRSLTVHGAAVILIHHDTKAQGATPRGHSILNGALDVALHLHPRDESGIVRGKLTKNRNGSPDCDIAFRIETEVLGTDEYGDEVTAALVKELEPGASHRSRPKLTKPEQSALDAFYNLRANGCDVASEKWQEVCVSGRAVSTAEKVDSRRKAFRRASDSLIEKGMIEKIGHFVRVPRSIGSAFDEEE